MEPAVTHGTLLVRVSADLEDLAHILDEHVPVATFIAKVRDERAPTPHKRAWPMVLPCRGGGPEAPLASLEGLRAGTGLPCLDASGRLTLYQGIGCSLFVSGGRAPWKRSASEKWPAGPA